MPIRLTLFLLFLFAQICEVSYAQWMPVGTHISLGETSRFDFSIGKDDDLYISYMDKQNQSHITVMKFNGSSWDSLPSIQTTCWALSMAVDGNNIPYIAAERGANTEIWKYFNGQWNQVGTPLVAQGLSHASLAIGKNDTVYMAARDDSAPPYRRLSVWKFDGTAWQSVGSRGFSADIVDITSVSFTIDQSGVPYVAYRDQAVNGRLTVKKFDGNSWVSVGNDGFSGAYLMRTSLVTDKAGVPYVAYNNANNNFKATVKKFDGNAWITVGTDGFSVRDADDFSLAMDKDDSLYIAYVSGLDDNAIVQKYDGVNWVNVGGLVSTGGTYLTILAINSKGVLYIAYDDHATNKRVIVKSYNKYAGITGYFDFGGIQIFPNPANDIISITGLAETGSLQLYDVSGRIVYEQAMNGTTGQIQIPVSNLTPGVYFIEIYSMENKMRKAFVKY